MMQQRKSSPAYDCGTLMLKLKLFRSSTDGPENYRGRVSRVEPDSVGFPQKETCSQHHVDSASSTRGIFSSHQGLEEVRRVPGTSSGSRRRSREVRPEDNSERVRNPHNPAKRRTVTFTFNESLLSELIVPLTIFIYLWIRFSSLLQPNFNSKIFTQLCIALEFPILEHQR